MTDSERYLFVPGSPGGPTIVGGSGVYLHTADGRQILDGSAGAVVGNIGWGRPEPAAAAQQALAHAAYSVPIWPTPHRVELVERMIRDWLPDGFTNVFLTSGGSESTDSALRLARAYQVAKGRPERWKVIGRHPSFHGMTLGGIAVASHASRAAGFGPMLLPFPHVSWNDPAAVEAVFAHEDPATIAGFIAEPITGAAGACLTAGDEYWRRVTDLCRRHDVLLIADEVMCGYGRTGLTWGHQHFPFQPDVVVGGKGLGGGYVPIGALATRADVAATLQQAGFMFFTYTGNDVCCAAASAVLDVMTREGLVERAASVGPVLGDALRAAVAHHPLVADTRGRGMFYGLELRCPPADVVNACLRRDLFVYWAGTGPGTSPVPNAVLVAPPFVITEAEIGILVERLTAALDEVAGTTGPDERHG